MTPDWQTADGSIRLWCDDCLRVLQTLEAGDMFMGSGTTIEAAYRGNYRAIGIEREAAYFPDCIARLESNRAPLFDLTPEFERKLRVAQRSLPGADA